MDRARTYGELLRPFVVVVTSIALVMAGIVIGSRLPGGDAVIPYPAGFALDYAGAPANSFAPLATGPGGLGPNGTPSGDARAPDGGVDGTSPDCTDVEEPTNITPGPGCGDAEQSVDYVATPAGLGVNRENSPASVGGQIFYPPRSITGILIADDNGAGVPVIVCQHPSGGVGNCNEPGGVYLSFCSTADVVDLRSAGFKPGYIRVRVDTVSPDCPTTGTTGTITIYF